mgnify:CR=1 FL=1
MNIVKNIRREHPRTKELSYLWHQIHNTRRCILDAIRQLAEMQWSGYPMPNLVPAITLLKKTKRAFELSRELQLQHLHDLRDVRNELFLITTSHAS